MERKESIKKTKSKKREKKRRSKTKNKHAKGTNYIRNERMFIL